MEALSLLETRTLAKIAEAADNDALYGLKVSVLGKKGELTDILKTMGGLPPEERPKMGQLVNQVKAKLEAAFGEREKVLAQKK